MRRTLSLKIVATLGTLTLLAAACEDEAESPGQADRPTPTVTETSPAGSPDGPGTPSPTADGSPAGTDAPTETPDGGADGTAQTFILAPQEPREVSVGSQADFSVIGSYDQTGLPDRLWLGVVPCDDYDIDAQRFTSGEATAQGFDEDFGPRIHDVNGEQYENVDDLWPTEVHVQDGQLTFTVLSDDEACAIPVVFEDTDDDGELGLGDDGTPEEPYGIGKATWS